MSKFFLRVTPLSTPLRISQLKAKGWIKFTQPRSVSNEGDCVQYVRHRPRLFLPVPDDPQP